VSRLPRPRGLLPLAVPALGAVASLTGYAALTGCAAPRPADRLLQVAVTTPVPGPSARAGGLVDGLPDVVPVPPGGHITGSALQARGDLLEVSVTGTSTLAVPALLAWFRGRLRAEGFTATDDSLLPKGASGAVYGRPGGVELLLVAVVDRGPARSWSVGGTVATRRDRR
jgi:hypothetical protein